MLAHRLKAGATVDGVGPVLFVSLSGLFPEICSGFLAGSGGGSSGFDRLANKGFHAWYVPSPVVGR